MENGLSSSQRQALILSHKLERDRRVADCIKAVLLADKGWSCEQIAEALFLSDESIRKHLKDYAKANKLKPENGGSEPHLSVEQTSFLSAHIDTKIYVYVKDICDFVTKTYAVSYSISGMTQWLKRNGFSYHKPVPVPGKADEIAQEQFIEIYEKLNNGLKIDEKLVFMDSVHPTHQTRMSYGWISYGWIKKGVRKELPTTAGQKRINLVGALNLQDMTLITQEYDTINAQSIIYFLDKLQTRMRDTKTIHVVLDCARYHTCFEVQEWIKTSRIILHFLPPYSPNLNAIERCWKIMHEHVTNNQYYSTFKQFTQAVLNFCNVTFPLKAANWTSRLTDNFRALKSPLKPTLHVR